MTTRREFLETAAAAASSSRRCWRSARRRDRRKRRSLHRGPRRQATPTWSATGRWAATPRTARRSSTSRRPSTSSWDTPARTVSPRHRGEVQRLLVLAGGPRPRGAEVRRRRFCRRRLDSHRPSGRGHRGLPREQVQRGPPHRFARGRRHQRRGDVDRPGQLAQLSFGIDDGRAPTAWADCGRPGSTVMVASLAVVQGDLYAGTLETGVGEKGRLWRYGGDGSDRPRHKSARVRHR